MSRHDKIESVWATPKPTSTSTKKVRFNSTYNFQNFVFFGEPLKVRHASGRNLRMIRARNTAVYP